MLLDASEVYVKFIIVFYKVVWLSLSTVNGPGGSSCTVILAFKTILFSVCICRWRQKNYYSVSKSVFISLLGNNVDFDYLLNLRCNAVLIWKKLYKSNDIWNS